MLVPHLTAQKMVADLRSVPVCDRKSPRTASCESDEMFGRRLGSGEVSGDGVVVTGSLDRVPAQSYYK
jgi:hypothetical protein